MQTKKKEVRLLKVGLWVRHDPIDTQMTYSGRGFLKFTHTVVITIPWQGS